MTTRPIQKTTPHSTATNSTPAQPPRPASPPTLATATTGPSLNGRAAVQNVPPQADPIIHFLARPFTANAAVEKVMELISKAQETPNNTSIYTKIHAVICIALEKHPQESALMAQKASCLLILGEADQACEWAAKALSIDPENATALTVLIDCEEPDRSESPSPAAHSADRNVLEFVLRFENPEEYRPEFERTLSDAEQILEKEPHHPQEYYKRMLSLCLLGKFNEMFAFLDNLAKAEDAFAIFSETLPLVTDFLKTHPGHRAALTLKAMCLNYTAKLQYMLAGIDGLKERSEDAPPSPAVILDLFNGLASSVHLAAYRETLIAAEALLVRDPKNRIGLFLQLECLRMLGKTEAAARCADDLVALYPKDDFAWCLLALCDMSKDIGIGLKASSHAQMLNPKTNVFAWFIQLSCLWRLGNENELVAAALKAQEAFPNNLTIQEFLEYYLD